MARRIQKKAKHFEFSHTNDQSYENKTLLGEKNYFYYTSYVYKQRKDKKKVSFLFTAIVSLVSMQWVFMLFIQSFFIFLNLFRLNYHLMQNLMTACYKTVKLQFNNINLKLVNNNEWLSACTFVISKLLKSLKDNSNPWIVVSATDNEFLQTNFAFNYTLMDEMKRIWMNSRDGCIGKEGKNSSSV